MNLLEPLHTAQKMSESGKSHIGHVPQQWISIRDHWRSKEAKYPQVTPLLPLFATRMAKQVTTIHWVAWALTPENATSVLFSNIQMDVIDWLKAHVSEVSFRATTQQFFLFRAQQGHFLFTKYLWQTDIKSDVNLFWSLSQGEAPELSSIALRVFHTRPNSLPSERASLASNFITNDWRTRVTSERANKLTFIFMNSKVLRRTEGTAASTWYNVSEEEEEALEDEAFTQLEAVAGRGADDDITASNDAI